MRIRSIFKSYQQELIAGLLCFLLFPFFEFLLRRHYMEAWGIYLFIGLIVNFSFFLYALIGDPENYVRMRINRINPHALPAKEPQLKIFLDDYNNWMRGTFVGQRMTFKLYLITASTIFLFIYGEALNHWNLPFLSLYLFPFCGFKLITLIFPASNLSAYPFNNSFKQRLINLEK